MCDQNKALHILGEVYGRCNDIFPRPIGEAYLYGSYARGDYHENSDIDILVTVDMDQAALGAYRNQLAEVSSDLSLEHDVTVSVTVKSQKQFHQYAEVLPFYQNVLGEGIRYAV